MKKLICVFVCITIAMISFAGCSNESDIVDSDAGNEQMVDAGNEYALYSNENYYPVSNSFLVGGIFGNLQTEYIQPDDPYPAQNWYTGKGLFIKASIIKPDNPKGEAIWYINAVEEGKTPRNVGIGNSLTEIMEAYDNELFIEKDWLYDPSSNEPEFEEVYIYAPPSDGTTLYLAFFINNGKAVMIETADGFELRPYDSGR